MKSLIYSSLLLSAYLVSSCDKNNLEPEIQVMPKLNIQDSLAMIDIYEMGNISNWYYENENWNPADLKTWRSIKYELDTITKEYRIVELHIVTDWGGTVPSEGAISSKIGNLSELRLLQIVGDRISGELPQEIGKLKNLTHLEIFKTNLSGSLPDDLFNSSYYRVMIAHNPKITGTLPSSLAYLESIPYKTEFYIGDTGITGKIPKGIHANIKLENNNLTEYPFEYTLQYDDSQNLTTEYIGVTAHRNRISGTIPDEILNDTVRIFALTRHVGYQQEGYGYTNMPPYEKLKNDYLIYLNNRRPK